MLQRLLLEKQSAQGVEMPLLIETLRRHRFKKVQLGLKVGWDVNERDPTNLRTPLIELSFLDRETMAVLLCKRFLDKGAKIGLRDKDGRNALLWACMNGRGKLVEVFLGEVEGFDLNDRDHQGNTALCLAVKSGSLVVVKILLKELKRYKLSVDIGNDHGETPLILASKTQNSLVGEILISEGAASTEIRDKEMHLTAKEWENFQETKISDNESSFSFRYRREHVLLNSRFIASTSEIPSLRQLQSNSSPLKTEALCNDYKDDLYKLFTLYQQQLTKSYCPSAAKPSLKHEKVLSDISILSENGDDDISIYGPIGLDRASRNPPIIPLQDKKQLSISTTVKIPLSMNKMRRHRFRSTKADKNQLTSVSFEPGRTKIYRRGSINVLQKLQVPVRKRHSSPLLRQQRPTSISK